MKRDLIKTGITLPPLVGISIVSSTILTYFLVMMSPLFLHVGNEIDRHRLLSDMIYFVNIVNNLYQIYSHVFSGTKFVGLLDITPYGSCGRQSVLVFNITNVIDVFGWLTLFLYYREVWWFYGAIMSFHLTSGIISLLCDRTFHEHYIGQDEKPLDISMDSVWRLVRCGFVLSDGISRTYLLCKILQLF